MEELPRGIKPAILLRQVQNTVPFLFQDPPEIAPYVAILQKLFHEPNAPLTHAEYFRLCVAGHWATVASFVPTDVDNQIRFRLWHPTLDRDTLEQMVATVHEALLWPVELYTTRMVRSPSGLEISGHSGEWFSLAAGAYCANRKKHPELAVQIKTWVAACLENHEQVFREWTQARNGIELLKSSTVIAHNLGDLVRVLDMWELPAEESIRLIIEKATTPGSPLHAAGELNKKFMATENHRHFALRKPKALRRNRDFLLPLGPFFDHWGKRLAHHPELSPTELGQIAEALLDGWAFLQEIPVGYCRALAGIEAGIPGGLDALCDLLPSRLAKQLRTGKFRAATSVAQDRFENQWNASALKFLQTQSNYPKSVDSKIPGTLNRIISPEPSIFR